MNKYKHLTISERAQIEVLSKLGKSHQSISKLLGRSQSTISREIKRNTRGKEWYLSDRAQYRANKREYRQRCTAGLKNSQVWDYVIDKLKRRKWSPETIAGRLPFDIKEESIHHETIYRYIYSDKSQLMKLYNYLKLHRKRRMKKYGRKVSTPVSNRTMIIDRPTHIESRKEFGHYETDNMEGVKSDTSLVTVTLERKTRYMLADIIDRKSRSKTEHINRRLSTYRVKSITTDNGSENAGHEEWSKELNTDVYFCNAYHSWEKGSVENAIGRIRRYIPKRRTMMDLTESKLRWVVGEYNNTPRKVLNYLTPKEVFMRELRASY